MFLSIEVELIKEKKKLKDCMNKETLSIFDQYLNGNKQLIMMKARQTGKSSAVASSLMNWKNLYDKYNRRLLRKESIKRIFNI
jgi:PBP1b-binding outer membrane lipoprotein LpoB